MHVHVHLQCIVCGQSQAWSGLSCFDPTGTDWHNNYDRYIYKQYTHEYQQYNSASIDVLIIMIMFKTKCLIECLHIQVNKNDVHFHIIFVVTLYKNKEH